MRRQKKKPLQKRRALRRDFAITQEDAQAMRDTAAKLESKESKKIWFDPALEALLLDMYAIMRPRSNDYEQRRILVQVFDTMVKEVFGNNNGFPIVEVFGSFVMDLFTARSDLDLSVNFSNDSTTDFPREKKISVLRNFAQALYAHQSGGQVSGVLPILTARVPVLKVQDCGSGIECDISIENKDGLSRSIFFSIVSLIDERFRILSYLMKGWAKAHNINSSKDHTMNSLSIISLVAFHLQTRDPPILPPFSALLKGGMEIANVKNNAYSFKNFGRTNRESVAELFEALLYKLLSVESLWQHGLCASTYEGLWISKTWKSRVGNMSVEDFLDRSENFARSVGKAEIGKIYKCIQRSLKHLSRFKTGQIEASSLKSHLFGSILLNDPVDQFVHDKGMEPKRRYPFYDSDAACNLMAVKRVKYSEVHREPYHSSYETPIVSSVSSTILHSPLRMTQDNSGLHYSRRPFVPVQSDYWLHYHPTPPIASQLQWQLQFTPEFGCGSQHQFSPHVPVCLHHESQHHESQRHQHDRNLMAARTWPDRQRNI